MPMINNVVLMISNTVLTALIIKIMHSLIAHYPNNEYCTIAKCAEIMHMMLRISKGHYTNY